MDLSTTCHVCSPERHPNDLRADASEEASARVKARRPRSRAAATKPLGVLRRSLKLLGLIKVLHS